MLDDYTGTCVDTPLGIELHAELLDMGHFDPFNGLEILKALSMTFEALLNDYEYIDDRDEWLERLHGVVKKAYPKTGRGLMGRCEAHCGATSP